MRIRALTVRMGARPRKRFRQLLPKRLVDYQFSSPAQILQFQRVAQNCQRRVMVEDPVLEHVRT